MVIKTLTRIRTRERACVGPLKQAWQVDGRLDDGRTRAAPGTSCEESHATAPLSLSLSVEKVVRPRQVLEVGTLNPYKSGLHISLGQERPSVAKAAAISPVARSRAVHSSPPEDGPQVEDQGAGVGDRAAVSPQGVAVVVEGGLLHELGRTQDGNARDNTESG